MSKSLQSINNELKVYVNEASGISNKCRSKLLKLVEKYFYVDLPDDNFLNVDVSILENGNIIMREEEFKTKEPLTKEDTLEKRYLEFQKEVEELLDKKGTNFENLKTKNEVLNLLVLLLIIVAATILIIFGVKMLLVGDYRGFIWFVLIIGYYFVPQTGYRFRNRLVQAKRYLKSLFKK